MATIVEPKQMNAPQRFLLEDVRWETYATFLESLGDRPGLYLTYDRGRLELMTKSPIHEWLSRMMGRLVEMLSFELDIPIRSGGSFTMLREDLERGLEPDECYWIASEALVRNKREIDLTKSPPPDLAIEIDVTNSSLNRQGIYAALGVPELWRYDQESIQVCLLQPDGSYQVAEKSKAFPFLPVQELTRFLNIEDGNDETTRLREFVAWLGEANIKP
jgi:Uma2 family endonuclease